MARYAFCIDERRMLLKDLRDENPENRLKAVRRISDIADKDQGSFLVFEKENPISLLNILYLLLLMARNGPDDGIRYEARTTIEKIRTILSPKVGKEFGCVKCGARIDMEWKYCAMCGASISGWEHLYKTCGNCGRPVSPEWNYCIGCKTPTFKKMMTTVRNN